MERTLFKTGDTYYCNKTYKQPSIYTYHIWANDISGNHNITSDYTFEVINQPPYIPSNSYPEDDATDVSIYADLSWVGGDLDLDPITYDVYFGTSSFPPQVVSNQSSTIYNPGTLEYFTTYYWQIVAWDNHGAYSEGPIWNFTTEEEYDINLFYRPQKDWVHNCNGDLDEINRRYQKYWKHCDFRVHATLESKLGFLCKQGDYDWVGAYYRNLHVQRYNRRIKRCMKRYRVERNTNESFNNYLKQHLGFETSLPKKGKGCAFKHTTLCLIAINAVAMTRLQNGETKNLSSVAYLA